MKKKQRKKKELADAWENRASVSDSDTGRRKMNKVILMGRLTRDPEVRYTSGEKPVAVARYLLAVERRFKREGEATADFIRCVAFGKNAEFAERYFYQGIKIVICGRLQTGSYTNQEGQKIYTMDVVVEEQDFAQSKEAARNENHENSEEGGDTFMDIPDDLDEELPFK